MGPADVCRVPQQRYTTDKPGKVQGPDGVGIVEGSCGYRASGVSIRAKFVLSRNLGLKHTGGGGEGRQVAKRSSDPREACHDVKVQVRDLV